MKHRRGLAGAALFLFLSCSAASVFGQGAPIRLNEELPEGYYRVCVSVESAIKMRENAAELATKKTRPKSLNDLATEGCEAGTFRITPVREEPSLAPSLSWNIVYDPSSDDTCEVAIGEKVVRLPCKPVVQEATFYQVTFRLPDGKRYRGIAEVFPTQIIVQYMEARKK